MTKNIEIDLFDKDALTEKYNKKNVSKDLINYIVDEAIFIDKNDTVEIIFNYWLGSYLGSYRY